MPTFPLPFKPKQDYHKGGLRYGADRDGGARKHAGCDLIAPAGTEILAVEDGEVVRGPYNFYHGTDALEFKLTASGRIVRYSEIKKAAPGVVVGTRLKEGALIAIVGQMTKSSMLHFEMYEGTETGYLTQTLQKPYKRRKDLMDPTEYLDGCDLWNVLTPHPTDTPSILDSVRNLLPTRWI